MLTRKETIFIRLESAYGIDSVPGVADAIQVSNLSPNPGEGARFAERSVTSGNLGTVAPIFGGTLFSLSFDMEIKGGSAPGVAPELSAPLLSCAHDETIVAGASVAYTPSSDDIASASIYYYQDGRLTRLSGCRGTVNFSATAGEVMTASFAFTGRRRIGDPQDQAFPNITFPNQSVLPYTWRGQNNFSWGGFYPVLTEFTLDPQLSLTTPANANSNDGYGEVRLVSRDPIGTIDPEDTLPSTQAWISDFENQQYKVAQLRVGAIGGGRVTIDLPSVSYREVGSGDRDGSRTVALGYKAGQTGAGNNEYSLTFD